MDEINYTELREDFGFCDKRRYNGVCVRDFQRLEEMKKMRFQENKTYQQIADKFDISRERVRQLLGNTGRFFRRDNHIAKIKEIPLDAPPDELSQKYDVPEALIRKVRSGERFKLKDTHGKRYAGYKIEEWVSLYLQENGIDNRLMPNGNKYDIETSTGAKVEVRASFTRMFPPSIVKRSPGFTGYFAFKTTLERNIDGFLILVVAEKEPYEIFVIPYADISAKEDQIHFSWPMRKDNKWLKYHNRIDLLENS